MAPFARLAGEDFAYLTTTGRITGRKHTIEIWFGYLGGSVYLLSGEPASANWVKNIRKDRHVRIRIGSRGVAARARIVRAGTREDRAVRELLDAKYMAWRPGKKLSSWARNALPVAVEIES